MSNNEAYVVETTDNSGIKNRRRSSLKGLELEKIDDDLLYNVDESPPWYICLLLGFQHYLEMIGATVACPFILTPALCMEDTDPNKANIANTLVFMSGIITILQTTVGTRLPIVQGGSFSYLVPSLAILSLPQWRCPPAAEIAGMSPEEKTELWQVRMREIQGAIIFAALFETIFALTGVIGFLTKFITPLCVAPAISLIALALFKNVSDECSKNYAVAFGMIFLLILFSQHIKHLKVFRFPLFQVFPVLLSLTLVWGICGILTYADVLPEGNAARANAKLGLIQGTPWFRIPYPFQWGWPTVSLGAVLGVLCGVMTSTIESIGDYYACAIIAKTPVPPKHAISRGIFVEGLGCVLGGIWGSGNGSTSYSCNIGTLKITKVASRKVIITSGIIMLFMALFGKAGAIFMGIPDPILGGLFCYIFTLVMAVGIGMLAEICLQSARNLFIISFAIFAGLTVSQWMQNHPGAVQTGSPDTDALIEILLSTGMFIAGISGFILDNTIPGTDEERGLIKQLGLDVDKKIPTPLDSMYEFPIGMGIVRRLKFLRFLPISPTYDDKASFLRRSKPVQNGFPLDSNNHHIS